MRSAGQHILAINAGSSSLRGDVYRFDAQGPHRELAVEAGRIGAPDAYVTTRDGGGRSSTRQHALPDHKAAVAELLRELEDAGLKAGVAGIGQRVVHGGPRYVQPSLVTADMTAYLRDITALDLTHMPQAIAVIEATGAAYPGTPQIACFDTAFHAGLPPVARDFALPRTFAERGIRRYGFHGLSYEYVMQALSDIDARAARKRIVIAHLGNGASMAAIRDGQCIDTTMGLTPAGGLVMGTRTGDLDPGVLLALAREGMSLPELSELVNEHSGLLGISGATADMQRLVEQSESDPRAAAAVAAFCYSARKFLGALTAALGGLDTLVFTGGIGEHAASVRAAICEGMAFAGLAIDRALNDQDAPVLSTPGSTVEVRVIPTNEGLMVARQTARYLEEKGS
jgi:acetate kinase